MTAHLTQGNGAFITKTIVPQGSSNYKAEIFVLFDGDIAEPMFGTMYVLV